MLEQFSFHYHSFEYIMINLERFLSGTNMCDIILLDEKMKNPVMKSKSYQETEEKLINEIDTKPFEKDVKALMSCKPGFKWHTGKEFAWRKSSFEKNSINLFDKLNILQINVRNRSKSGLNDVIVFYFPENLPNFRLSLSDDEHQFNDKERILIGKLIESGIHFVTYTGRRDILNWDFLQKHSRELELELLRLRAENDRNKTAFTKNIVRYCQRQLEKIAVELGLELAYSEDLIDEFKKLQEIPLFIDEDIKKAIKIKNLKEKPGLHKTIIIEVTDIKITFEKEEEMKVEDKTIEIEMRAPYSFLERIETAMLLLDYQRKPFTGENVGAHMTPSVTKSAITQYRNTYQKSIRQLLQLHPEKWTLTRNHFKPIKNLLDNQEVGKENKKKKAN